ncbi:hypothetical protein INQ41_04125 [Lysobacter ciconiae]|uniref:Uncharacterized protein n=1 Tax=Novilysobacter ciconiae TaxID=2781022 RepID=A0A7S6UH83_9GAMM|nr:hypothetical protein [Lysobacter ciconiae]QOW20227.1 hypothetical protein INQ41_04125 [Lysobacter ciconiae]
MAYSNGVRYYVTTEADSSFNAEAKSGPEYESVEVLLTDTNEESAIKACENHAASHRREIDGGKLTSALLNEVRKLSNEYRRSARHQYATDVDDRFIDVSEHVWLHDHFSELIQSSPEESKEIVATSLREIWMNSSIKSDEWLPTFDDARAAIETFEQSLGGHDGQGDVLARRYEQLLSSLSPPDVEFFGPRLDEIKRRLSKTHD